MVHRRWIVILSTYFTDVLALGLLFAVPVLFSTLLEMFKESRAKTATISSVLFGFLGCAGIITGLVIQRIGPRKAGFVAGLLMGIGWIISFFATSVLYLVLVLAVPMGIGCSMTMLSISRTLSFYFPGKLGQIALSVQATASGVGRIIFTYALSDCVNTFGLRGTFLIMGAVLFNCSVLSILWNTELPTSNKTPQSVCKVPTDNTEKVKQHNNFLMQFYPVLKDKIFILFVLGITFLYAPHGGFTEGDIRLVFVIHSICNICGRLSFGFIKQIPRVSSLFLTFLLASLSVISFSTIQFAEQLWSTIAACSILGFEMGATVTAMSIGTLNIVGYDYFPFGLGIVFASMGAGNVIVGPISGIIRDVTGTYTVFLWTSTLSTAIAAILILGAMLIKYRTKLRKDTSSISVQVSKITKF
ncbi:hypothetical protein ACJMK2_004289 [Sinanodonta woodiana]|uniref:Uncharacterized protein n=1 Tax=Sinanodonta woodiana TaxID=1069815 RepID=A0ABD3Y0Q6_SINWO